MRNVWNIERQRDKQRYIYKVIKQKRKVKTKTRQNKQKTRRKLIPTKTWWTISISSSISTSFTCHVTRVTNSMITLERVIDLYRITNLLGFFFAFFIVANTKYVNDLSRILIGLLTTELGINSQMSFFYWPLCCLSFFNWRRLNVPLWWRRTFLSA